MESEHIIMENTITITKEELLKVNSQLNKVKKPTK